MHSNSNPKSFLEKPSKAGKTRAKNPRVTSTKEKKQRQVGGAGGLQAPSSQSMMVAHILPSTASSTLPTTTTNINTNTNTSRIGLRETLTTEQLLQQHRQRLLLFQPKLKQLQLQKELQQQRPVKAGLEPDPIARDKFYVVDHVPLSTDLLTDRDLLIKILLTSE